MNPADPNFVDVDAYLSRIGDTARTNPSRPRCSNACISNTSRESVREPRHSSRPTDPARPGEFTVEAGLEPTRRLLLRAEHAVRRSPRGTGIPRHAAGRPGAFAHAPGHPRTHMFLNITLKQTTWLADVGFGGEGLFRPIPMVSGVPSHQHDRTFRLVDDEGLWVLQS